MRVRRHTQAHTCVSTCNLSSSEAALIAVTLVSSAKHPVDPVLSSDPVKHPELCYPLGLLLGRLAIF